VAPETDPLLALHATPSMKATLKYFWWSRPCSWRQVGLGAITAHYGVEGRWLLWIPLSKWLPYAVTRTWHTQLGIFWIATAWLATGCLWRRPSPATSRAGRISGQLSLRLSAHYRGRSLAGEWLGVQQKLGLFPTSGSPPSYEYVDLGRFWQIFLLIGLFLWLLLMGGSLWPALKDPGPNRHLLALFLVASTAIAVFYAAGLMWGRQTIWPWLNTGAGGWCICGWRASLKCSPRW